MDSQPCLVNLIKDTNNPAHTQYIVQVEGGVPVTIDANMHEVIRRIMMSGEWAELQPLVNTNSMQHYSVIDRGTFILVSEVISYMVGFNGLVKTMQEQQAKEQ